MATDLTTQREDREKAIQEVREENRIPENGFDDAWILKCYPASIALHERAIRAERECDEAVRTLQTVRSGFSASHYVARVIDAWSQAAHPANGGQDNG